MECISLTCFDGEPDARGTRLQLGLIVLALFLSSGCMFGPSYVRPPAKVAAHWIDAHDPRMTTGAHDYSQWWGSLNDPVLNTLVEIAYGQNLTLRAAGVRVIEAQARRGVTIGTLFPQFQELQSSYTHSRLSANAAN